MLKITTDTVLAINTLNDKGCYAGMTALDYDTIVKIHPDKPAVISVEKFIRNKWKCRSYFTFIPQDKAVYFLASESVDTCTATVASVVEGQSVPVAIRNISNVPGFACIKN